MMKLPLNGRKNDSECQGRSRSRVRSDLGALSAESSAANAEFIEDDNYVSMEVQGRLSKHFPEMSDSKPEEDEPPEHDYEQDESAVDNMQDETMNTSQSDYAESVSENKGNTTAESAVETSKPNRQNKTVDNTLDKMRNYMLKKGLIHQSMEDDELLDFIENDQGLQVDEEVVQPTRRTVQKLKGKPKKDIIAKPRRKVLNYQPQQLASETTTTTTTVPKQKKDSILISKEKPKVSNSSSSDDYLDPDTSDETLQNELTNMEIISDRKRREREYETDCEEDEHQSRRDQRHRRDHTRSRMRSRTRTRSCSRSRSARKRHRRESHGHDSRTRSRDRYRGRSHSKSHRSQSHSKSRSRTPDRRNDRAKDII